MIAAENEIKVHAEINRLSGKRDWPRLQEGQLELVRTAKKYARDIPHLHAAITALCESLDHCPDSRELRQELRGAEQSIPESRTRCLLCDDSGTLFQCGEYRRCDCRIGRMIHRSTLDDLNNPVEPRPAPPEPRNSPVIAKILDAPLTQADVDREIEARRKLGLAKAAGSRSMHGLKESE